MYLAPFFYFFFKKKVTIYKRELTNTLFFYIIFLLFNTLNPALHNIVCAFKKKFLVNDVCIAS